MPHCGNHERKLVEEFDRQVMDVIQVGARSMQNFDLLTEAFGGQTTQPDSCSKRESTCLRKTIRRNG